MSPIRSSAAAGSSHALGDNRFAKVVSEVTAQRLEGRKTALSGAVNTTATLNQTPTAGNHLIVFLSSNSSSVTPACSYGGDAGTQITGSQTTGICGYAFYIPLTSANIASGGTTLNITSASGPTVIGYSVAELSGVYAASPVDTANVSVGSWSSSNSASCTDTHTTIGALRLVFVTLSGSQTSSGFLGGAGDYTLLGTWGSFAATNDIYAMASNGAIRYTATGTLTEGFVSATARNGVMAVISFRPAA